MNWTKPTTLGTPPPPLTKGLSDRAVHLVKRSLVITNELMEVYLFDTTTMCWSKPPIFGAAPPCVSMFASAVVGDKIYFFGGVHADGSLSDELFILDTATFSWSLPHESKAEGAAGTAPVATAGTRPSPRRGHSATVHGPRIFFFGGAAEGARALSDLWSLDTETLVWTREQQNGAPLPEPRAYHGAATEAVDGQIYVYGGTDGEYVFGDLFRYEIAANEWHQITVPSQSSRSGVYGHSLACIGSCLWIFGGHDEAAYSNELYLFNLRTGNWQPAVIVGSRPSPRGFHSCNYLDHRLYVIGGRADGTCFSDIFILDLACYSWIPLSS
jgi:N-acetylneuraminic acid mutarotase